MIITLIGIQWSGKWTQARILKEKYWFKLYEAGQVLREISKKQTDLWKLVKQTIEGWKQVSPEIVEDILRDIINNNKWDNLILDWFVRNSWNKKSIDKIVWDYEVIFFDLPIEEARKRLLWRMYDPITWETFMPWTTVNPKTWNKLTKRSDDEEAAIDERIKQFFEKTMPVVEQYKKEWNIKIINANQSIKDVTDEIIRSLGL